MISLPVDPRVMSGE